MKSTIITIFMLLVAVALFSCGSEFPFDLYTQPVAPSSTQYINSTPTNPPCDLTTNEVTLIQKALLGNMIFHELIVSDLIYIDSAPLEASNQTAEGNSINAPFTGTAREISWEKKLQISSQLIATGTLETIHSTTATGPVFNFAPLLVAIQLTDFTALELEEKKFTATGEISCTIKGRYESPLGKFFGGGHCQTGTAEENSPLLLTSGTTTCPITYDVDLEVSGQPFTFDEYKALGTFVFDGQGFSLPDDL